MNIKIILKKYDEQPYSHEFDNLYEKDQFPERHNLPKLTQDEIENLNWPISMKEIESMINKTENTRTDVFIGEFY